MKDHRTLNLALSIFSASCLLLAAKIFFKFAMTPFVAAELVILVVLTLMHYPAVIKTSINFIKVVALRAMQSLTGPIVGRIGKEVQRVIARKNEIVSFRNKARVKELVFKTKSKLDEARQESAALKKENFVLKSTNKRNELELSQLRNELEGMQGLWMAEARNSESAREAKNKSVSVAPLTFATDDLADDLDLSLDGFQMSKHGFITQGKDAYKESEVPQEI